MPLFQQSVLKKYKNDLDKEQLFKAWLLFRQHFLNPVIQQNIRSAKEEQYQEGFLRELFVTVLGYTLNPQPSFNLTTEYKNEKDSKKADGAIINNGSVRAVIELKGTDTTDLSKIETQAFSYLHNHKGCTYVITSNFEKLRFYINDATDFEEFNLFTLTEEQFALLYLCLQKDKLLGDIPLSIKQQSVAQEDTITKKLYADYSTLRKALFQNIVELNQQYDKLELFKKTQKLLDRFLFIFFAEDRLLLPPNFMVKITEDWKQLQKLRIQQSVYDRFKLYFNDLRNGNNNEDIFAYNGGLFEPDETLDNITIDDIILLNGVLQLSKYDYNTEVDVNILGHIFEHSLTEIEELQKTISSPVEGTPKIKSRRKKEGVFYTPRYITKYIVENTIGALCTERKNELFIIEEDFAPNTKKSNKRDLLEKLDNYRNWLLQLTICDPACGSGAFLNAALEFLIAEHRYIDELSAKLLGHSLVYGNVTNDILENNLFGVDINEEAVEIARLSLWLRTAQKGRKLSNLSNNIKVGNSLIDDPAFAGEKTFEWEKEFPEVFVKSGFDVMIGNPPYVRQEMFKNIKPYFADNYKIYNSINDLFAYFYELSFRILNPKGILGFISNTFSKTTAGYNLRRYIQNEARILKYIDFTEVQVFEGATTYPIIMIASKIFGRSENYFSFIKIPSYSSPEIGINLFNEEQVLQDDLNENSWNFNSLAISSVLKKMKQNKVLKELYGKSYRGVLTGLNEAFIIGNSIINNSTHTKSVYEGKDILKWYTPPPSKRLILIKSKWTNLKFGKLNEDQAFEKLQEHEPQIAMHLAQFKERAKARFDKGEYWWELRNCAYYPLFEKEKIIFPNLQNENKFCYDETGVYVNAPAVILPCNNKALLPLLNSKLIWYFLKSICVVRAGGYIEVKPQYFEQIPIPEVIEKQTFIEKADIMLSKNKDLHQLKQNFLTLLLAKHEGLIINKKLGDWIKLSSKEFLKEMEKQKLKLSLSQQQEWLQYFEEEKQKATAIQQLIDQTDKEIDAMVYELYGLTEEEIKIVEGS